MEPPRIIISPDLEELLRAWLSLAAVALMACGGVDFTGQYTGTVAFSGTCTDGSSGSQALTLSWVLADSGDAISIASNGTCSPWTARAAGNVANLDPKNCPTVTDSTGTYWSSLKDGTATLRQRALEISLHFDMGQTGAATCHMSYLGSLLAQ